MTPQVSIIIPVYNVEPYIRECLDSVVNQTLQDIQIICVNDGSTDRSLSILKEYDSQDSRIEIIDKPNGGVASARNAGLSRVKGKYLFFVDSDDFIDNEMVEKLYYRAEQTGADIVQSGYWRCDIRSDVMITSSMSMPTETIETYEQKKSHIPDFYAALWAKLYRSEFILSNQIRCPQAIIADDLAFSITALLMANKVAFFPQKLYYYRDQPRSLIHRLKRVSIAADNAAIFTFVRNELIRLNVYELYKDWLALYKLKTFSLYFRSMTFSDMKQRINTFRPYISDDDIRYFKENGCMFTKQDRRIISGIIANKLSQIVTNIQDLLVIWRELLYPLRVFNRKRRYNEQKREYDRTNKLCDILCDLSQEIVRLKENAPTDKQINRRRAA